MEASLNGCGKLLDKINALHTTFAEQPEAEYEGHGKKKAAYSLQIENSIFSVHLVLNWLNLPELRDIELERIAREYDRSTPWTENDVHEKRTTPNEFKAPEPIAPMTQANVLLSTQIAYKQKREEIKIHHQHEPCSTPLTNLPPKLNSKLSPIDKPAPSVTRLNSQVLMPIKENSPVKRLKTESNNDAICLNTIDDLKEDDFEF